MQVPVQLDTLKDIHDYVSGTRPVLEKMAAMTEKLPALAERAVDTLCKQGLLNENLRARKVAAYIENPLQALVDLQTVAANTAPPSLGGPGGTKEASLHEPAEESANDAFARTVMEGRAGAGLAS